MPVTPPNLILENYNGALYGRIEETPVLRIDENNLANSTLPLAGNDPSESGMGAVTSVQHIANQNLDGSGNGGADGLNQDAISNKNHWNATATQALQLENISINDYANGCQESGYRQVNVYNYKFFNTNSNQGFASPWQSGGSRPFTRGPKTFRRIFLDMNVGTTNTLNYDGGDNSDRDRLIVAQGGHLGKSWEGIVSGATVAQNNDGRRITWGRDFTSRRHNDAFWDTKNITVFKNVTSVGGRWPIKCLTGTDFYIIDGVIEADLSNSGPFKSDIIAFVRNNNCKIYFYNTQFINTEPGNEWTAMSFPKTPEYLRVYYSDTERNNAGYANISQFDNNAGLQQLYDDSVVFLNEDPLPALTANDALGAAFMTSHNLPIALQYRYDSGGGFGAWTDFSVTNITDVARPRGDLIFNVETYVPQLGAGDYELRAAYVE